MAVLPKTDTLVDVIDKAVEHALSDPPRPHLGASQIGQGCERALWYSFRWALQPVFSGRMLRLFNRGHEEEARFIRWMTMSGITVNAVDAQGKQFSFKEPATGNHFAGSMDGAAVGIPGAEKTWHVLEFKTSSDKAFRQMVSKGVTEAKPLHYAQMQVYMHWTRMTRALYLVVNKNDDSLYSERIAYDKKVAERLINKARRIVEAKEPPSGISDKPDWFECKFCDFHSLCHGQPLTGGRLGPEALPNVHCRTCLYVTPELDGDARWSCAKWDADSIPVEGQRQGCAEHRYIPALIPWAEAVDVTRNHGVVYKIKYEHHQPFVNGTSSPSAEVPCFSSQDLQNIDPVLIGDKNINQRCMEIDLF